MVIFENDITELNQADIQQVIYAVTLIEPPNSITQMLIQNSRCIIISAISPCHISLPSLSNECHLTEEQYDAVSLGICLEPYFSKINYSCQQNAYWCFNGREIQIRAEQDIEAGQELFIAYVGRDTYEARKERLWKG